MKTALVWLLCVLAGVLGAGMAAGAAAPENLGIFGRYAANRAQGIPNYITEDFLLLSYAMLLDDAIASAEQQHAYPEMEQIVSTLLARAAAAGNQNRELAGTREFLAVISALLKGETSDPDKETDAELQRVLKAAGVERSPVLLQQVDYSQFRPRGHYTRSETLSRYFRAYRYASTALFYVVDSPASGITPAEADQLTSRARALVRAISGDEKLKALYETFNARWDWTFGPPEDLLISDFLAVEAKSKPAAIPELRTELLETARKNGRQPQVLSGPVDVSKLAPKQNPRDVLTGWRLFPQRFNGDSAAFQELVFDRVREYKGKSQPFTMGTVNGQAVKTFPRGLEIFVLLGSKEAGATLDKGDDRNYQGYQEAAARAAAHLKRPTGMNSEMLDLLGRWSAKADEAGLPSINRRLNSALGLWTYGRYLNVLQAKQSYTMVEKSIEVDNRDSAWIEPAVDLYQDLRAEAARVEQHLGDPIFAKYTPLLDRSIQIAQRERSGAALSKEDVAFLNGLDRDLRQLTGHEDEPIVVDVHTDLNSGQVLEEGLGWGHTVEHNLGNAKAVGALLSYYEFKHPVADRLTDAAWQDVLRKGGPK